jgi:hypothetical protein
MPSIVTGGDVCEYQNRSMFLAKILFNRENSKDKNRRRISKDIRVTLGVPQGSHLCFIWFVNRISMIFKYVRVLFYADDLMLFLPIKNFLDCTKIQSDLNKLSEWWFLNVDKRKTITFSRIRYPVEFSYMLDGTVLDQGNSINDLGGIMNEKINFSEHIDFMVGKAFAIYQITII